jgi:hypothetical protein
VGVWRQFATAQFAEPSEPLRSRQAKSRGARTVLEHIWRRAVYKGEASRFETETSSITLQRAYRCAKVFGLSKKSRAYPFVQTCSTLPAREIPKGTQAWEPRDLRSRPHGSQRQALTSETHVWMMYGCRRLSVLLPHRAHRPTEISICIRVGIAFWVILFNMDITRLFWSVMVSLLLCTFSIPLRAQ